MTILFQKYTTYDLYSMSASPHETLSIIRFTPDPHTRESIVIDSEVTKPILKSKACT